MIKIDLWLVVAIAVLATINWSEPGLHQEYPLVTDLNPDEIEQVKLFRQNELVFELQRKQGTWQETGTQIRSADEEYMERLLHISQLPSLYRISHPDNGLEQYGLAIPAYRLQFNDIILEFGNTDPISKLRYLAVGNNIHLISDGYYHYLSRSPFKAAE